MKQRSALRGIVVWGSVAAVFVCASVQAQVTNPPVASFTASPTSGTAPLNVLFTDTSSNAPTAWAWDFQNDGIVDSTDQNPSHLYATPGAYSVKLTVSNAAGTNSVTKASYITAGEAPNAIPYGESFETYALGTKLAGSNGWFGGSNAVEVIAENPGFVWGYPLPSATHTQVLQLTEAVTNMFTTNGLSVNQTNVWIDVMVSPIPRESAPGDLPTDVQTAIYMGSDTNLHVYHAYYNGGNPAKRWATLQVPGLHTGVWTRVTLKMDYLTDNFGTGIDKYFQISVNGGKPISDPYAYKSIPLLDLSATNGTWFLQACSGQGAGNTHLTSLSTEGPGKLDDVVVDITPPAAPSGTIFGVPVAWYINNGITDPAGDKDGDGYANWQEWVAGTDPNNASSKLELTGIRGKAKVTWSGSNTVSGATYTVLRTTDILTPSSWAPVQTGITTPTWTDPNPPQKDAYYKVVIPWTYTN